MKMFLTFVLVLFCAVITLAQDETPYDKIKGLPLSAKEIADLSLSGEHRGSTYVLSIQEYKTYYKAKQLRKLEKKGKVPFRICVTLSEEKRGKTKKVYRGKAEFYVVNTETNKITAKKKLGMNKLCPS